jgi:thiol-disulfide isomerase/thioredoxin
VNYSYSQNHEKVKNGKVSIVNGKFEIVGKIQNPTILVLTILKPYAKISFYINEGLIYLNLSLDSIKRNNVNEYRLNIKNIKGAYAETFQEELYKKTKVIYDSIVSDSVKSELLYNHLYFYAKKYPTYNFVADLLCESDLLSYNQAKKIFDIFSIEQKKRAEIRNIKLLFERLSRTAIGAKFIYFEQPDSTGKKVTIENIRFKYLLVNFWASNCGPCRKEHPELIEIYNANKKNGFEILSISLDNDRSKWLKAAQNDKIPWLDVSDLTGIENENAKYYSLIYIPFNILINDKMEIIDKNLTPDNLEKKLGKLLFD